VEQELLAAPDHLAPVPLLEMLVLQELLVALDSLVLLDYLVLLVPLDLPEQAVLVLRPLVLSSLV
jgi:hypothetical protein